MEKEFIKWMKQSPPVRKFQIGDKVQVIGVRAEDEELYRIGDEGIICSLINKPDIRVKFDQNSLRPERWLVRQEHLKII